MRARPNDIVTLPNGNNATVLDILVNGSFLISYRGMRVRVPAHRVRGVQYATIPACLRVCVGKRDHDGWHGYTQSLPKGGKVEVLWMYDKHSTTERIDELFVRRIDGDG